MVKIKTLGIVIIFVGAILASASLNLNTIRAATQTNINLDTTTYIGGSNSEIAAGVEILDNEKIVVAGTFPAPRSFPVPSQNDYAFGSGGTQPGVVLVYNASGTDLEQLIYVGNEVHDIAGFPGTNDLVVAGDFGIMKLENLGNSDTDPSNPIGKAWENAGEPVDSLPTYSQGIRVDVGDDGVVAALFNVNTSGSEYEGEIYVIEADGSARQTGSITLPETDTGNGGYNQRFEDIAVDAANSQIIVTGYTQRCSTYQSPFVLAYSYTVGDFGTRNWRSFSLWCSGADDESLTADSRGVRVEIGEDGSLLFVGKADGGNNLFTRQAQEHTQTQTNNVEIDRWNSGAGFGTGEVAYIAKLNKQTGQVVDGQFQYTSTGVNQAESFAARAVQSNILGQTYWGGSAEKDLPERASLQLDGVDIGPRIDNETALIAVSSDFSERELVASWTSAGSPGTGEIQDIAINGATVAVLARTSWEIVTSNAQDSTYSGADDLFLAVWGSADVDPTLAAPDASFNLNTTSGTGPLTVYPSNLSAFNSQNTYEWDMGDGTTYNSYTFAEHQFSEAGTYEVQYTITNSQGTDTSTVIVEVQASAASTIQAFRFWSDRYRSHFYTSSIAERDLIISSNPNWKFEGNAYRVLPLGSCGSAKPVYRFWSSRYRSHFYTSSVAERDVVINSNPNWKYEGESYCVFTTNVPGTTAVYRFWSDRYRSHFYTSSVAERDVVINSNQNWEYEGIAYYVYP